MSAILAGLNRKEVQQARGKRESKVFAFDCNSKFVECSELDSKLRTADGLQYATLEVPQAVPILPAMGKLYIDELLHIY